MPRDPKFRLTDPTFRGEFEYEVSFGLVPRNKGLPPLDPETLEPFDYPFQDRNPEPRADSKSPQNVGSVDQNLGFGAHIPRDKGSMIFFWNGERQN